MANNPFPHTNFRGLTNGSRMAHTIGIGYGLELTGSNKQALVMEMFRGPGRTNSFGLYMITPHTAGQICATFPLVASGLGPQAIAEFMSGFNTRPTPDVGQL